MVLVSFEFQKESSFRKICFSGAALARGRKCKFIRNPIWFKTANQMGFRIKSHFPAQAREKAIFAE
jgi:hypothetical protein